MAFTAKQKSFIAEFRSEWIRINDVSTDITRWDLNTRERYNKSLARFLRNNPQIFEPEQLAGADHVLTTPIKKIDPFTLGDAAGVFFTEAGNQVERINPFSEANKTLLWIVGGIAIVTVSAVVAFRVTPKNIKGA